MPWRKGNRLRLVNEEEADEATRRILGEIRRALGLPALQLFYPALAVYPTFLRLHWDLVAKVAGCEELFHAAECLRADAYTRAHNYFPVPDLSTHPQSARPNCEDAELSAAADFYHYMEPLHLLLFCYQMQALEGPTGEPSTPTQHTPPDAMRELPCPADERTATAPLRKRLEEIRRVLAVPYVNTEYCVFARRTEFFEPYWASLKRMMASPVYDECRYGVRSTAWNLAARLPGPAEMTATQLAEAGMQEDEIASVARILELFVQNLSGQLLNVATAKIALEGGNLVANESQVASGRKRKSPAA